MNILFSLNSLPKKKKKNQKLKQTRKTIIETAAYLNPEKWLRSCKSIISQSQTLCSREVGIWTSARPGLSFWTRWSKVGFGWKGLLPPFSRARPWLHQQLCFHIQVHETQDSTILILTVENLDWCCGLQLQTSQCGLGTLWVAEVLSRGSWDQNYVYINNNTKMFVFFTLGFSWVYMEFFRGYLMWDIRTDWMQKPTVDNRTWKKSAKV